MVALAVVAIALPALLVALSQHIDATGYLRDKSVARQVAANKLEELHILSRATRSLLRGKDSGVAPMAGRDWYWWLDSQPTEQDNFYRIEIDVAASEEQRDQPLFTLVAFFSADLQAAPEAGGENP
jgi:general secretion pathway protein I